MGLGGINNNNNKSSMWGLAEKSAGTRPVVVSSDLSDSTRIREIFFLVVVPFSVILRKTGAPSRSDDVPQRHWSRYYPTKEKSKF